MIVLFIFCFWLVMGGGIGICLMFLVLMLVWFSNCECWLVKGESFWGEVCLMVFGEMLCFVICFVLEYRFGLGG